MSDPFSQAPEPLRPSAAVSSSGSRPDIHRFHATVVVTTYNRAYLLDELITALAAQQTPDDLRWELVLVDNNSRDNTRQEVERLAPRMRVPVRYVLESSQGMSHARNRGVREARGTVVGILDDDVLPAPDWVAAIVASMDHWRADGIGGRILPKWETPPPRWLTASWYLQQYCFALMKHNESRELSYPMSGEGQIWGSNMAFRHRLFEEVGYFETGRGRAGGKLYRGGEEEIFVNRALQAGRRMVYDPSLLVLHRIGSNRMRKPYLRKFFFHHGEGEALVDVATGNSRGAPRWQYSMTVRRFVSWLGRAMTWRLDAFEHELDFLYECGKLWGYWKARSRPSQP